jgi:hypothetical protein
MSNAGVIGRVLDWSGFVLSAVFILALIVSTAH